LGPKQEAQGALFYEFSIEGHVPQDHLLPSIDRFVDLSGIRHHLAPLYSNTGRPSIDPELLIRMLLVGYCLGIRSERRLCEEVHLNLAYRWFCRLDLADRVPDHSTFSKNRYGRFRDSDLLRHLFETTVARCIAEGLVSGQRFAADASLIHRSAGHCEAMSREAAPMPTSRTRPRRKTGTRQPSTRMMRHAQFGNIWRFWMMQPLARPRASSPSSRPTPTRPASGRQRATVQHSLPDDAGRTSQGDIIRCRASGAAALRCATQDQAEPPARRDPGRDGMDRQPPL
jgi:transposase